MKSTKLDNFRQKYVRRGILRFKICQKQPKSSFGKLIAVLRICLFAALDALHFGKSRMGPADFLSVAAYMLQYENLDVPGDDN